MTTPEPFEVAANVAMYLDQYELTRTLQEARHRQLCVERGLDPSDDDDEGWTWGDVFDEIPTPKAPYRWLEHWEEYEDALPDTPVGTQAIH